jgi:adenine phosphoribosyltransferase
MLSAAELKSLVREVADFPQPGILFRDIALLLKDQFAATITALDALFSDAEWRGVDAVAGIESRGFILAAGMAQRRGKGFVPIRKKGKLPPPVIDVTYTLEYGAGSLEMQYGSGTLLLIDDVLATGGTLRGACDLSERAGYRLCAIGVLIDLKLLPDIQCGPHRVRSVIDYGG